VKGDGELSVVSADYTIRAQWDTAYVVDVTVVVDCADSDPRHRSGLSGWKIGFSLGDDTKISKMWNAELEQHGNVCTAVHERLCVPVSRDRAVLYFGFEGKSSDPSRVSVPRTLTVNGQVCGLSASYARDLADCYFDYLFEQTRSPSRSPSPEPSRSPSPESRSPSRSPSPARDSSLPPNERSSRRCSPAPVREASPHMISDKRMRTGSPSFADSRDFKFIDEDEANSIAQTPPRNFSPESDVGEEVSGFSRDSHDGHSPSPSGFVQSPVLGKRKAPEISQDPPSEPQPVSPLHVPRTLEIDYYRRSKALKQRKFLHMDYLDTCCESRESVILRTVLDQEETVLEPNMFPYDCPPGVTHWTLWSKKWLEEEDITDFVSSWIRKNLKSAVEWNHDDNMSDGLSINLFHVHVYIRCPV